MAPSVNGLPAGWELRLSKSKKIPYYVNHKARTCQWFSPEGTDMLALKKFASENFDRYTGTFGPQNIKARVAHILVKHRDSRRPSSWREETITRSKEEAMEIIHRYENMIRNGEATLRELAATRSDDVSAKKSGDLGFFGWGATQPEFEKVVFGLGVGELSKVVETDSGLHLIQKYVVGEIYHEGD